MANISFNKLNCKINSDVKKLTWGDCEIEVKQYLPIQEKLGVMEEVIGASMSQYNYANPVQVEVFTYLAVLKHYTNIKFTDKQMEDPAKLYDMTRSSGLIKAVCECLPENEVQELMDGIDKSVKAFYAYRTSVLGILDVLKTDYSNLNVDLAAILNQIKDPEALKVLTQMQLLEAPDKSN